MTEVEAIGSTFSKRSNSDRERLCVGFGEHLGKNGGSNALALSDRFDVEVVEEQFIALSFEHNKADALAGNDDVSSLFCRKSCAKTLACADGVEPPNAFETFAHCLDSSGNETFEVDRFRESERDWNTN
jgi:hypothetical protein